MPGDALSSKKSSPIGVCGLESPSSVLVRLTSFAEATSLACALFTGMHTFLRIRPPSPSSSKALQCIQCVDVSLSCPLLSRAQSIAEVTSVEGAPQFHGSLSPGSPVEGIIKRGPTGSPQSLTCTGDKLNGLKGVVSLASGRNRAHTNLSVKDEENCLKNFQNPQTGIVSTHISSVHRAASVLVLPPLGSKPTQKWGKAEKPASRVRQSRPQHEGAQISSVQHGSKVQKGKLTTANAFVAAPPRHQRSEHPALCPRSPSGQKGYEGPFRFGELLLQNTSQETVFRSVGRPAADAVLRGANACIAM